MNTTGTRRPKHDFAPTQLAELVTLYTTGTSMVKCAALLNAPASAVRRALEESGTPIRGRGRYAGDGKAPTRQQPTPTATTFTELDSITDAHDEGPSESTAPDDIRY